MKTGILMSGGLDSTALLYWKRPDIAFFINYGQICADGELKATKQICKRVKIPLSIICVNFQEHYIHPTKKFISPNKEWIPYRNQLLSTFAAMMALNKKIKTLYIGTVKSDKRFKDGTPVFIDRLNKLISYQEGSLQIKAPAIKLNTTQLIQKSKIGFDLLAWCHSCTQKNYACGSCDSCKKHREIFSNLGYNIY